MATPKKPRTYKFKSPEQLEFFKDYWRKWLAGERFEIFDSRESLGVGHYKLWKKITSERRLWRRFLRRHYGYDAVTGKFCGAFGQECQRAIPSLEASPEQDPDDFWQRLTQRRSALRHPFYRALRQYLVACQCLSDCGDPPELLANPRFVLQNERRLYLTIGPHFYFRGTLLDQMRQAASRPGETYVEACKRPRTRFVSEQMTFAFDNVYGPLTKLFDPASGPEGDTEFFYGALAYVGISLKAAKRLRAGLKQYEGSPYESLWQLIPGVIETQILPDLWAIDDPEKKIAGFKKLPGKVAYALEKALGVAKKPKLPQTTQFDEEAVAKSSRSLDERVVREQINEQQLRLVKAKLDRLTGRQREVYILNRKHKLTLREIADRLGIKPGTAASHLARARSVIEELNNSD